MEDVLIYEYLFKVVDRESIDLLESICDILDCEDSEHLILYKKAITKTMKDIQKNIF